MICLKRVVNETEEVFDGMDGYKRIQTGRKVVELIIEDGKDFEALQTFALEHNADRRWRNR